MAKPFSERLATGLKSTAQNVATLRALIEETEAERDRQNAIAKHASADSVDVTLGESDRDEAAAHAERATRLAQGYADAVERLQAKLAEKLESDDRRAAETEKAAAIAERDELAAELRDVVRPALDAMIDTFRRVNANTARLQAAGVTGPNAEAVARDVPRNFYHHNSPIDQLTKLRIPAWDGHGRAWPRDFAAEESARIAAEQQHARAVADAKANSPQEIARRKAQEDAKFGTYLVTAGEFDGQHFSYTKRTGQRRSLFIRSDGLQVSMLHSDAERARRLGLKVEAVEAEAAAA